MTTTAKPRYGFRVLGSAEDRRRLADAGAALAAYAAAEAKAEVEKEGYLSAFWFGDDFREHLETTGSTAGFTGACWAPWLWFDIDDADDPERALRDAGALASALLNRYRALDDDDLLLFFSGSKGYHVGLPICWEVAPSATFHQTARCFAEALATAASVSIDRSVYDKVRLFRAPNSRHPKTGLHKRRLTLDELLNLTPDRIRQLASEPAPFDVPTVTATCPEAAADWLAAEAAVTRQAEAKAERQRAVSNGAPTLNRATLAFIRDGAEEGERRPRLFSAAANLAEFRCPPALAHALLSEAALDAGLSPADVRRQIECGLAHVPTAGSDPPTVDTPPAAVAPPGPDPHRAVLADLWARQATAPPPPAPDDVEQRTEAEAVTAEGGKPDPPAPPAGARFHYQSDRGRACGRADAATWTWEGAPRWYHVADFAPPERGFA